MLCAGSYWPHCPHQSLHDMQQVNGEVLRLTLASRTQCNTTLSMSPGCAAFVNRCVHTSHKEVSSLF